VHPIRVRLLTLLQEDGPATASQLGRRVGHSSGVTSYHLRILAENGFVEEDTERGNGRDRYWRSRYRQTSFTFRSPDDPPDESTVELAEQYVRMVVDSQHARMVAFIESMPDRLGDLASLPWTFDDTRLRLTLDEARALAAEVRDVIRRYARESSTTASPSDAVDALFLFQMLPDDDATRP
jgi:DNA-binding transcriptional ArsR family regulator